MLLAGLRVASRLPERSACRHLRSGMLGWPVRLAKDWGTDKGQGMGRKAATSNPIVTGLPAQKLTTACQGINLTMTVLTKSCKGNSAWARVHFPHVHTLQWQRTARQQDSRVSPARTLSSLSHEIPIHCTALDRDPPAVLLPYAMTVPTALPFAELY
jgi:hypothetical protein